MIRQQAPPKEKISKFALVIDWLRNRNTMEFLGVWESVYNPHFNYGDCHN